MTGRPALTGQPYSYAADNPINATDPTGEISLDQALGIAATVGLAVASDGGSVALEEAGAAVEGGLDVSEAAEVGTDTADADDAAESASDSEPSCGAAEDAGAAERTFQTYTKVNPETGEVYAGRTSGYGTPLENLAARDASHAYNAEGFGPAELDQGAEAFAGDEGVEDERRLPDRRGCARLGVLRSLESRTTAGAGISGAS